MGIVIKARFGLFFFFRDKCLHRINRSLSLQPPAVNSFPGPKRFKLQITGCTLFSNEKRNLKTGEHKQPSEGGRFGLAPRCNGAGLLTTQFLKFSILEQAYHVCKLLLI